MNAHEFTALNERLKAKQAELFGHLTQDLSAAVTPALERLLHILDWVRLEHFIDDGCGQGRPPRDHFAIANAFMAKAVLGIRRCTHLRLMRCPCMAKYTTILRLP